MSLSDLHTLVAHDFREVNHLIVQQLQSRVPLVNQISHYIINSGGKRIRPLLVLLCSQAFQYEGKEHLGAAAIIEFIHTATLLHDDVVDHSLLRRGQQTVDAIWGSEASVLVGDFLYSRAFQMMIHLKEKNLEIMRVMADATNTIAEGEVLQLIHSKSSEIDEQQYMQVIYCKTAKLFEAAAQISAILVNGSEQEIEAAGRYGRHLGQAFQLIDDALDYSANPNETGKNLGDDLAQGKITLPLIFILKNGSEQQAEAVKLALVEQKNERLEEVIAITHATGAIAYVKQKAQHEAQQAQNALQSFCNDNPYRKALSDLVEFAVSRSY